jgi:ribosomal-protein-alanine N-acetyltransferase
MMALERAAYSHPWSEASLRQAVEDTRRFHALVLRGPALVGYCVFQLVADELHVHNVTVAPERRRNGLARRMLEHAFDVGRAAGARVALLEVRETNQPARALYAALGFDEVGHRRGYYVRPVEDAILLSRSLASNSA